MTKKVNPQLFRIKKYNFINSAGINFFDNLNQFYYIKRNIYFFIKFFRKFRFFFFYFKLQRNNFNFFKLFFLGYFLRRYNFFFLIRKKKHFKKKKKTLKFFKKKKEKNNLIYTLFLKKKKKIKSKKIFFLKKKKKKIKSKKIFFLKKKKKKIFKKSKYIKFFRIKKKLKDLIEFRKPEKLFSLKNFLLKKKLIFKQLYITWFFLNITKSIRKIFWKNHFKKIFKQTFYKLRMWPKRLRGIKWKFSLINLIQLNFHHKINTIKKKKKFFFFKLKNFNFLNFTCKFIKFYYFKFYYLFFKKKKIFKIKNKLFKYNINNLFNKIFNPFKFNIYIKTKLNTKKLNFLKFFFFNIYKNNFFKNFNFVKKQYFLSFLYTIWYKNINFLTFYLWNGFNSLNNRERYIIKNFKSFLKTVILIKFGILGIKVKLKGKLFRKRRKKIYTLRKGSINLVTLKKDIKFLNYNVFTRAGTFNFKCWLVFI